MKKDKLFVFGMSAMALVLGLDLAGCATGSGTKVNNVVNTVNDVNTVIGGLLWQKQHFYATAANPWKSQQDKSLTLVFTETQLNFRYDSNGDGDFDDPGEYTYTYTITNFGGTDWSGGANGGGNYERVITVNNETKTGAGTNAHLTGKTEFVVTPNLGGNGKIDGTIWLFYNVNVNDDNYRFSKNWP